MHQRTQHISDELWKRPSPAMATTPFAPASANEVLLMLTREIRMALDPLPQMNRQPIVNSWAGWPQSGTLAPFLVFRCTVSGRVDPATGCIWNVKNMDSLVRDAVLETASKLANHPLRPAGFLHDVRKLLLDRLPTEITLEHLELAPTPYQRFGCDSERMTMITLTQQFEFSAAHRLHNPLLTAEENRRLFGKCNNPHGHGHNYLLNVSVNCPLQADGEPVVSSLELQRQVMSLVVDRFDHKHLNHEVPEFREVNPTVENIARTVWQILRRHLPPGCLRKVRVYETSKTWAEVCGT